MMQYTVNPLRHLNCTCTVLRFGAIVAHPLHQSGSVSIDEIVRFVSKATGEYEEAR